MIKFAVSILLLSVIFAVNTLQSQPLVVPKPKFKERPQWEVSLGYSMSNASIYHDADGNRVSILLDTLLPNGTTQLDTAFREYTFQLSQYAIFPSVKWMPTEDFSLSALINFSYSMLDEKFRYDSNYFQQKKADFSLLQVDYLELSADYYILNKKNKLALSAGTRIPFGFEKGQFNNDFLCDGAIELIIGSKFQLPFDGINIAGGVLYNWRDEDFASRMIYNLKVGIVSVPGTELSGFVNYIQPLKPQSDFNEFNIRYRPINEETIQAGAAFRILFDSDLFANLGYYINLGGRNTFGNGTFQITLGTSF